MALKRIITEFGSGNDLHGGDYTKAAVRAVEDAIHHSSLSLIRSLAIDSKTMQVEVTVGVQQPDRVEAEAVRAALPHGEVTVRLVKGGLDVSDDTSRDVAVIAAAAVTVRIELP
jgi:uncharacterized protein (TIGR02058 family)